MKISLKIILSVFLILPSLVGSVRAGQQVYLSQSPNNRYRIMVEQIIDRRVGEKVFFRYPISLVNSKNGRHFEIQEATTPLVRETERQTFQVHWDSIHFDWAKDSLKLFIRLEIIEGTWRTLFVDVNKGTTTDITADLEQFMVQRVDFHDWACQEPTTVQVVQWTKPYLAFLKVIDICGKDKEKENKTLFYMNDSLLFDTHLGKAVTHCADCKDEKALKVFEKYFQSTQATPTPTPEETPAAQ